MLPRIVVTISIFPGLDQERAAAARYGTEFEQPLCSSEVFLASDGARAA